MLIEKSFSPDEIQFCQIDKEIGAVIFGDRNEVEKKVQLWRATPKLLELVSEFVSAEHEERRAISKKIRIRHEAEDLLKTLPCVHKEYKHD